MSLELTCKQCGRAFVPTREDLVRGPGWYRFCSEFCRRAARDKRDDPIGSLPAEAGRQTWCS